MKAALVAGGFHGQQFPRDVAVAPRIFIQVFLVVFFPINSLVRERKIATVTVMGKRLCIKQSVIDYYASAEKLSHPKEEYYRDLIRVFKKRQCREREKEKRREKRSNPKKSVALVNKEI